MTEERFLTDIEVANRYSVSRITPWVWARRDCFPKPVRISSGTTRWRLSELEAYEEDLPGAD
ncbi:AlpA family phage regulatory protein [Spiribacter aquaticus]|uniref:AlpA family phage regulatory protein n=1 Tax=Spiribacter aquaticus TaxID=1935996 RepID=A0A557RE66_9GAMM|nr:MULTISPECIES: AlpA family phage regulatory protein [Spiribacter]KAF0279164.1 hypothetical protein BA897_00115 [Spiribacter roseus]TVO63452.1 AlpA family phage regulatory protein [Spiribacter aquaticus]